MSVALVSKPGKGHLFFDINEFLTWVRPLQNVLISIVVANIA